MRRIYFHESYSTVGAREDIDRACEEIIICPNRLKDDLELVELYITDPTTARRLARQLNKWAKIVSSL